MPCSEPRRREVDGGLSHQQPSHGPPLAPVPPLLTAKQKGDMRLPGTRALRTRVLRKGELQPRRCDCLRADKHEAYNGAGKGWEHFRRPGWRALSPESLPASGNPQPGSLGQGRLRDTRSPRNAQNSGSRPWLSWKSPRQLETVPTPGPRPGRVSCRQPGWGPGVGFEYPPVTLRCGPVRGRASRTQPESGEIKGSLT